MNQTKEMDRKAWSISYRPRSVDDFVFPSEFLKTKTLEFINNKQIPHLFFHGHAGTGKTTLANILANSIGVANSLDYLRIDGSKENSVDTIRNRISQFINLATISDCGFKIVYIDECDYLSLASQAVLRTMMEDNYDNVRFILSCNYPHKIIPEIKSRCLEFEFKNLDKEQMLTKAVSILLENGIDIDGDEQLDTIQDILESSYPDFRKFLNKLQLSVVGGKIDTSFKDEDSLIASKIEFLEILGNSNIDWESIRNKLNSNISDDQFEEFYRFFYEYLHEIEKFKNIDKWKAGIVIIADHLYKHSLVADKEINFMAALIRINGI